MPYGSSSSRFVHVASFLVAAATAFGCAPILGIDDGVPSDTSFDGSIDATDPGNGDGGFVVEAGDAVSDAALDVDSGPCPAGSLSCNGVCIPSDAKHCGSCNHDCTALAHVAGLAQCTGSTCSVPATSCAPGYAHCSANADDGCETDISTPAHCGSCASHCSGATPVCAASGSASTCVSGCSNDGGAQSLCSGSCVDTQSNPNDCNACGHICPGVTNGQPTCVGGACAFACNAGRSACSGACVDLTADSANCGTCGHACTGGKTCAASVCQCPSGLHDCGGTCVSDTAVATCGTSCNACPTVPNGQATCAGGTCGITCSAGFTSCNGQCVDVSSDRANCGACGHSCTALANVAGATCQSGTCAITSCTQGHAACNADPNDGCETDTSQPAHCGACATQCTGATPVCGQNGTTYTCVSGCTTGQSRCGQSCVDEQTDPANCGACSHGCGGPPVGSGNATCAGATCGFTCQSPQTACGVNGCYSTQTDPSHCGASCTTCAAPSTGNGSATCGAGACGIACSAGYAQCGSGGGAGCYHTQTDPAHCSCATCPGSTNGNGTTTCTSGACGYACNSGFCAVGGGCSSNASDPQHCGASCNACPQVANATPTCTQGGCGFTCNTGYCAVAGGCANVLSDAANCGACGHSCGGGACSQGVCKPTTLVNPTINGGNGIALDAAHVYYTTGSGGAVLACGLNGCGGVPQVVISGLSYASKLVADGSSLFVTDSGGAGKVLALGLGTTPATVTYAIGNQPGAASLAVDPAYLYWGLSAGATPQVMSAKKPNGAGVQPASSVVPAAVAGIWYDAATNAIYAAAQSVPGYVYACPADSPSSCISQVVAGNATDVVVVGSMLYFTALGTGPSYVDGGLFATKLGFGSTVQTYATGAQYGFATAITADATNVYFASQNQVFRCALAGCQGQPTSIGGASQTIRGVATDATAVYWVSDDGGVYKVAK